MSNRPTVYLAGGMNRGWRDTLKKACGESFTFYCPVGKEDGHAMSPEEYGVWDLHHVRSADIVFGYMEAGNPSGIGLSCEIGFAYGLGKTVILVLEDLGNRDPLRSKKLEFMKVVSAIVFDNFEEGVRYLMTFSRNIE